MLKPMKDNQYCHIQILEKVISNKATNFEEDNVDMKYV